MEGAQSLNIDIRPSRALAGLLGAAHVLALCSAWVGLGGWPLALVLAGVSLSAAGCLALALGRSRSAVRALELHPDGRAFWKDGAGLWHPGRLSRQHLAVPALVVVGIEGPGRARRLVLLPDSVERDGLRRLRVWLRWPGQQDAGNSPSRG
jgi:membrane-bound toxin of toxin-antitoxin system